MTNRELDRQIFEELWQSARADVEGHRHEDLPDGDTGPAWEHDLKEWIKCGFDNWWKAEWDRALQVAQSQAKASQANTSFN